MSYQWYLDDSVISGATAKSYTILTVLGSSSGTYCVRVTNSGGSVTSSNAYLNVTPPPTIATQPVSEAVTEGQNASFSVVAAGTGPFTYQWYFNGSSMGSSATSATLSLSGVGTASAGSYSVVVANSGGSVTSSVAALTVYVPVSFQSQPQSQTVAQGQTASFSVSASGTSPLSYQWYFDSLPILGATSASLNVANAQTGQAGSYTVIVSNPAGSATSQTATLAVNVPPSITTEPQGQAATQNGNVVFSVAASGTSPLTYQWYLNGSSMGAADTSATLSLTNVSTNSAGNYTVVVQNAAGSVTSSVAALTVISQPVITAQPQSQTALPGANVQFGVTATGAAPLSYAWNFNGTPLAGATSSVLSLKDVSAAVAGNYSVVVSNAAGSVASSVATLKVPSALSVSGALGSVLTSAGFAFQLAIPPGHTYIVMASSDFLRWTPIATNLAITGSETFTDTQASNYPSRIYRVIVQ